jgi:hypothetical protein
MISRKLLHLAFLCVALLYLGQRSPVSANGGIPANCQQGPNCCVWVWGDTEGICENEITLNYACWDAYHNLSPNAPCATFTKYDPDWAIAGDCEFDDSEGIWYSVQSFACYHTLIDG